jgi:hypothetical protein
VVDRGRTGARFRVPGVRRQGLNQESGVRSQNEDPLLFRLLSPAYCRLPSGYCLLPTADCLLSLGGVRVGGTLGPYPSLRQHVILAGKEETLASLKSNERYGNVYENKGSAPNGQARTGNVIENTGSYMLKALKLLKTKEIDCMW